MESARVADQPVWLPMPVVCCRTIHRDMCEELLECRLLVSLVQVLYNYAEKQADLLWIVQLKDKTTNLFLRILSLNAENSLSIGCRLSINPLYFFCLGGAFIAHLMRGSPVGTSKIPIGKG